MDNKERISLNRQVFDKNKFSKTINTSFSQLISPQIQDEEINLGNVEEFFTLYNELFFQIPKFGPSNSHEFLIKESSEYVNFQQQNQEIQALLEEIAELRRDNLSLRQENINILSNING